MNFAQNQAVTFQAAERLGQHLLGNPPDGPAQLGVALGSVREDVDNERGPFVRDPVEDYS